MQCDLGSCDLSPCDLILGGDITGLSIFQCANWARGSSHGGGIGTTRIFDGEDQIFQRTSLEDNQNGAVYYYKTFWKNIGVEGWPKLKVEVTVDASSQFARESVAIAIGTTSDDMTNKPNDTDFSNVSEDIDSIDPEGSIPLWIRQTITPGGTTAERGQNISISIMLTSVE